MTMTLKVYSPRQRLKGDILKMHKGHDNLVDEEVRLNELPYLKVGLSNSSFDRSQWSEWYVLMSLSLSSGL